MLQRRLSYMLVERRRFAAPPLPTHVQCRAAASFQCRMLLEKKSTVPTDVSQSHAGKEAPSASPGEDTHSSSLHSSTAAPRVVLSSSGEPTAPPPPRRGVAASAAENTTSPHPEEGEGVGDGAQSTQSTSSNGGDGGISGIKRLFAFWQQGVVASIGAVMGIGFLLYLLYTPVKEDTVHHTAVVASEALGDVRLKGKAVQLSKDVVAQVLEDDKSLQLVVELVRKLLAQEDTKVAISSLLQSLFEDHYTQEVTKKFVLMIVRDPWIMDQLQVIAKEQVLRLLADKEVKKALSNYLTKSATDSLQTPELQYETARAIRRSFSKAVNPWI